VEEATMAGPGEGSFVLIENWFEELRAGGTIPPRSR
jgi:hypothetical protein